MAATSVPKMFNAIDVVDALDKLRADADKKGLVNQSEFMKKFAGKKTTEADLEFLENNYKNYQWYEPILHAGWDNVTTDTGGKGAGSVKRVHISCTLRGVTIPLKVGVKKEKTCGWIHPHTTEEALWVQNNSFDKKKAVELRKNLETVQIQIQKYTRNIKIEEDGKFVLPPDSDRSIYFRLIEHLNEFLNREVMLRKIRGYLMTKDVDSAEDFKAGALAVPNPKICPMIQSQFKSDGTTKPMPNPMTRPQLTFPKKSEKDSTPAARNKFMTQIFDGTKSVSKKTTGGTKDLPAPAKIDGKPVDAENVHRFIRPSSIIDLSVDLSTITITNQGISFPAKVNIISVSPPVKSTEADVEEFFDTVGGYEATKVPEAAKSDEEEKSEEGEGEPAEESGSEVQAGDDID